MYDDNFNSDDIGTVLNLFSYIYIQYLHNHACCNISKSDIQLTISEFLLIFQLYLSIPYIKKRFKGQSGILL